MKQLINDVPQGPKPAGPYSLGVIGEGKFLFVSGQGPFDHRTGKFERLSIAEQTELALGNVKKIVEAAGGKMENVVSCRVHLQPWDAHTFQQMNSVYQKYFPTNHPARTTIGCQLMNMDVEIDCIVALD
jgi:2-iminobutanoate/2-iminopropanoate deaminase